MTAKNCNDRERAALNSAAEEQKNELIRKLVFSVWSNTSKTRPRTVSAEKVKPEKGSSWYCGLHYVLEY